MAVGVEDRLRWVVDRKALTSGLAVLVVGRAAIRGEVGSLVDERSRLGIGTGAGGIPESTAQINGSKLAGIWSRALSVTEQT